MRTLPIYFAALVALALMGVGLKFFPFPDPIKPLYAAEIVNQEIAKLNDAAPKFKRRPLLASDVKVLLDQGHGSGVHLPGNFYLTAAHVVANPSKRLDLKFRDGSIRKARVLWANKQLDVALLYADGTGVESANLSCREVAELEPVTLKGNPTIMEFVTSTGKVAGVTRGLGQWERALIVDATILPGQSGGPAFDAKGDLIGLVVGVATVGGGFSFSMTGYGFIVPGPSICQLLART